MSPAAARRVGIDEVAWPLRGHPQGHRSFRRAPEEAQPPFQCPAEPRLQPPSPLLRVPEQRGEVYPGTCRRSRARASLARGSLGVPLPNTAEEPHPSLPASFDAAAGDILPASSTHSISWIHLWRLSPPIANTNESSSPDPRTSASTPSTVALGSATTRLPASRRQPKRSSTTALRTSAASRGPPVPGPLSASARNRSSTNRPEASENSLARMACRARGALAVPPRRSRLAPGAPPQRGPKRIRCPRRRRGSSRVADSSPRGLPWPIPNGPTGGRRLARATFCKHR